MRKIFFLLAVCICIQAQAQNKTMSTIVEGGRVFVDILKTLKTPKRSFVPVSTVQPSVTDSCQLKSIADLCYFNKSGETVYISLYKRNGNTYAAIPLTLTIIKNSKECVYEVQAGIYKYKIETIDEDEKRIVYKEGEMRLLACDVLEEEIH